MNDSHRLVIAQISKQTSELLDGVSDEQRSALNHPFTATELRHNWTYVPRTRAGLTFADLDRHCRKTVHKLLATVLSPHAYAQAATIMALEDVLDHAEDHRLDRHQCDYWIVLFGDPATDASWGWRFEGHHLSINITVRGDRLFTTPCFFGANPAVVRYGDTPVVAPLNVEERLARTLLRELDPANRALAVVSDVAPDDIRTRSAARVDAALEPSGVPMARLRPAAAELLRDLLALYLHRFRDDISAPELLDLEPQEVYFAWEGHPDPGHGHYYRIQADNLLVEYDNTADDANHIHSVIRRPSADFGENPLAGHLAQHRHRHDGGHTQLPQW
jgi:hypothetical protein